MYAIIQTGGKQIKVAVGESVFVEKLDVKEGDTVTFDKVLLVGGEKTTKVDNLVIWNSNVGYVYQFVFDAVL